MDEWITKFPVCAAAQLCHSLSSKANTKSQKVQRFLHWHVSKIYPIHSKLLVVLPFFQKYIAQIELF